MKKISNKRLNESSRWINGKKKADVEKTTRKIKSGLVNKIRLLIRASKLTKDKISVNPTIIVKNSPLLSANLKAVMYGNFFKCINDHTTR